MDGDSWQLFIFLFFLISASFFAASESAFSTTTKIKMKARLDAGQKRAKSALWILNHSDKALSAVLIGNNICHIAAASVATLFATRMYEAGKSGQLSEGTVTLLCTIITTFIVFLFSEMIPKTLATDRPEGCAMLFASSLRLFMKCFAPLVFLFDGIAKMVTSLFAKEDQPTITEEELYDIVDTMEEEGEMDEKQSDLFKSALDFSQRHASDIMSHNILAIDSDYTNEQIADTISHTTHSRIPVYQGDLNHIVGILPIRVFIREYRKNKDITIQDLLLPPFFLNQDTAVDDLLTVMQENSCYLAIVTNASGETAGLLTIEDCLEELVGEIWDEDEIVPPTESEVTE